MRHPTLAVVNMEDWPSRLLVCEPVTVKKLLGKLNCGVRTVSLSGIELGWKKINEMRTETWNVHILHRAGTMNEMVKEVEV